MHPTSVRRRSSSHLSTSNKSNITQFLALLPLLTHTPLVSALTTARLWAQFYPRCPSTPSYPFDGHKLHEEYISAVNIYPDTCASVFVPLSYAPEVTHLSIAAELAEPGTKCTIAVHEVPGCVDQPLIEEEVRRGVGLSACKARNFISYNQVWVKMECVEDNDEEESESDSQEQPVPSRRPVHHDGLHLLANKTMAVANQTAPSANQTIAGYGGRGNLLRRVLRNRS
ncbi:uncharacterized protein ACLA_021760 [Aspergillus clavatus NRRL 1]|uniref:Uncharacterized protein n=1 Tax=Aspergillus clavatus (strain ATCC 1007 / CBS 513.65 / DSM 816 / NCTC 3887 / NRRL 1 / QM 1276 / 107) TaxID=344612 RepID=A1CP91_ASPCL|nr:uncharacterized protein ACLA_021760 [Aspergillus clavatus NRRL 1]EAW07462.1 conserved hypothetical protein [Aspergillus clavatus NRRL 1]